MKKKEKKHLRDENGKKRKRRKTEIHSQKDAICGWENKKVFHFSMQTLKWDNFLLCSTSRTHF